jgi:uncharacterized protein (TIRG00374 family)
MTSLKFNYIKIFNNLWLILKLSLFIFLIYLIYKLINKNNILNILNFYDIIICLMISSCSIILQIMIFSFRFHLCSKILNMSLNIENCIKSTFLGGISSNTPLSFLGGDLARIAFCKSQDMFLSQSIKIIYLDRIFGFMALIFTSLIFLPFIIEKVSIINKFEYYLFLFFICLIGIILINYSNKILMFFLPQTLKNSNLIKILSIHNIFFSKFNSSLIIFLISILATLNFSLSFYLISLTLGYGIDLIAICSSIPIIMLASMLPLFFSGWGVREFSAIYILGLFNVTSEESLVLSIIYGISLIISYLPGIPILIKLKIPKIK